MVHPSLPTFFIALIIFCGLWLCLWRGSWRLFGGTGNAVGLMSLVLVRPPDIIVGRQAKLMAVRTTDGGLEYFNCGQHGLTEIFGYERLV